MFAEKDNIRIEPSLEIIKMVWKAATDVGLVEIVKEREGW